MVKDKSKSANETKEFILEFFKNSKLSDKNGVLTIEDAPSDFELFLGEKAPYKLVFDFNKHNEVEGSELILKGSYFLSTIRDYLRDKGQTSLLKINIDLDQKQFKEKILEVKKEKYSYLTDFTFLSICQYLNEKNQFTTKFLVKDKEILDLDLSKFKLETAKKEEFQSIDIAEQYKIAQNKLKDFIKKETKDVRKSLLEKLGKELHRVKDHYYKQIKEKDEELERCEEKIKLLQGQLKHTFYERDIRILEMKIRESKTRLEELKQRTYRERMKAEEVFHVNDETDKHAMAINHRLINAAIIYYPIYTLKVSQKGKTKEMDYDPVFKKFL